MSACMAVAVTAQGLSAQLYQASKKLSERVFQDIEGNDAVQPSTVAGQELQQLSCLVGCILQLARWPFVGVVHAH